MKSAATARRTGKERDELVEQYLPLVRHVVARLPVAMPSTLDRDDFFSVGVIGLMHAAATYDSKRGASFKTFAYTAIRGAVLDEIRKHDPVPRNRRDRLRRMSRATEVLSAELGRSPTIEELAERLEASADDLDQDLLALHTSRMLSLDDPVMPTGDESGANLAATIACEDTADPGEAAATRDQVDHLARAVADLPDTERSVVVLYHYESLYLKEIGELLGVTESRVCQVLSRATERLRLRMRDRAD